MTKLAKDEKPRLTGLSNYRAARQAAPPALA
jgi:hypothetical protein